MRHGIGYRKLNKTGEHRKALFKNMLNSLIKYEQIITTLPKAKELKPQIDKVITIGKKNILSNKKRLFSKLQDKKSVTKVFDELSKRYSSRKGGYSRVLKAGFRTGDDAPMAVIELVDRNPEAKKVDKPKKVEKAQVKTEALRIPKNNEQKPEIKKVKKQETEKREYKVKDYVVYPKHGVGQITEFKKINIGGIDVETYILKFEKDKANGMVPVNKQSHLRPLATINQVNKCISILKSKPKIKRSMWSRRAQEYEAKISSGKIYELAEVVRDLNKGDDLMIDQSYSERQLFEKAYDRLLTEFQIVMGTSLEDTQKKLDKALKRNLEKQIQKVEAKPASEDISEEVVAE